MSYASTLNETAGDVWYEKCILDGTVLLSVAYGVHATLFFACFNALLEQRKALPKQSYSLLVYCCLHFICGTFAFACHARLNEMTFVTQRDFPGGPKAYFIAAQASWLNYTPYVMNTCTAWLQDILLIWRYWVFWDRRYYMLVVPVPLFLVSFIMATLVLAQIRHPGATVWVGTSVNFLTTFWAVEITTTIFITTMIVIRLVYMRIRLRRMGNTNKSQFLSVAAMLVESGLLFSVAALVFVISYAKNNPFQTLVVDAVGQIQSIAPLLIILRVAQGRSITQQQSFDTTSVSSLKPERPAAVPLQFLTARARRSSHDLTIRSQFRQEDYAEERSASAAASDTKVDTTLSAPDV